MNRRNVMATGLAAVVAIQGARLQARASSDNAEGPWTDGGQVRRAGGVLNWRSLGSGPVLVVMPKLGGWIADWAPIAPLLAPDRTVIAIDPPGHGGSVFAGPPPQVQTLAESAAMVRAALHELGHERYALAGNSLGGCIAAKMAMLFPEEVERLALISVALGERQSAEDMAAAEARKASDYDADGRPLPRAYGETAKLFRMSRAVHEEQNRSRDKAGLWIRPSERGVAFAGLADDLAMIEAPTLLLYGKGSTYERFRAPALAAIPEARAATLDEGAFMHQQAPRETAEILVPWLAGRSQVALKRKE